MPFERKNNSQKRPPADFNNEIIKWLPAILCELEPDGKTVYVNETITKILEYKPHEIIDKNWWDIFCGHENRNEISRLYEQVTKGDVADFELDLLSKSSKGIPVNWNSRNIYSDGGKFLKVIGIAIETSGKRHAEEALRQSLERYKLLLENQGEGFAVVDENEIITFANPSAEELFGVGEGELLGRSLEEFTSNNGFNEIKKETERRKVGEKSSYDLEIIRTDGTKRYILVTCTAQFDSLGNYKGAYGIFRDITDRKKFEESLSESEERFRRFAEVTNEGILIHDKGKILDANKKFANMLGYNTEELIGGNSFDLVSPETRDILIKNVERGYEEPYEAMGLRKDGSTFPIEIHGKATRYKNSVVRVACIRDLTLRKVPKG